MFLSGVKALTHAIDFYRIHPKNSKYLAFFYEIQLHIAWMGFLYTHLCIYQCFLICFSYYYCFFLPLSIQGGWRGGGWLCFLFTEIIALFICFIISKINNQNETNPTHISTTSHITGFFIKIKLYHFPYGDGYICVCIFIYLFGKDENWILRYCLNRNCVKFCVRLILCVLLFWDSSLSLSLSYSIIAWIMVFNV